MKQSIAEQVFNFMALYGMSGTTYIASTARVDFATWGDGTGNINGFCSNLLQNHDFQLPGYVHPDNYVALPNPRDLSVGDNWVRSNEI